MLDLCSDQPSATKVWAGEHHFELRSTYIHSGEAQIPGNQAGGGDDLMGRIGNDDQKVVRRYIGVVVQQAPAGSTLLWVIIDGVEGGKTRLIGIIAHRAQNQIIRDFLREGH